MNDLTTTNGQVGTLPNGSLGEIQQLIAVAKQYPRDIKSALSRIETLAMIDKETMESCFYALERTDSNGEKKVIEGPSVKLATICLSSWGNIRATKSIVGNDGKKITASSTVIDIETLTAVTLEVSRRITTSKGFTYSEDMQIVTGNAAASIALRNAVFTIIPQPIIQNITVKIKGALKQMYNDDLEKNKAKTIAWLSKRGVTEEMILKFCQKDCIENLDADDVVKLCGMGNAIKDGMSPEEVFASTEEEVAEANIQDKKTAMRERRAKAKETDMP